MKKFKNNYNKRNDLYDNGNFSYYNAYFNNSYNNYKNNNNQYYYNFNKNISYKNNFSKNNYYYDRFEYKGKNANYNDDYSFNNNRTNHNIYYNNNFYNNYHNDMNKKLYNDFNNKYFSSNNNINNNDNYNNYINKTNHSKNHYLNKNLNYNNKYINNYSYNNPNLKAKKRLDKKDEIKLNSEKNEIKEINKNIDINNYNDNFIKEDEVYKNFLRLYNIVKTPIESLFLLDNYNELTFELKKKLLEIFQITEMKEEYFYRKILQLIDENGHKICLKLLNIIIFFIEKKIIPINNNENIKVNAFEYF